MQPHPERAANGGLWLGVILIVLGLLFLLAILMPQSFAADLSQFGWPLLILGFAAFFEGLLHISGRDFGVVGQAFLPAVLILFGVLLLVRRVLATHPDS